ncbi:MAG: hypothetical protein M3P95_13085 [Actinomycetota bacterium]|nr:hypothetical protein [Actinomycetota bacterium]
MTVPQTRTSPQTHLAAEHAEIVTRWHATQDVRDRVAGVGVQDELLATLGPLDATCPPALPLTGGTAPQSTTDGSPAPWTS